MSYGTLYLIPVPLADDSAAASYTPFLTRTINAIDEDIIKNENPARNYLRQGGLLKPQTALVRHAYGKPGRERADADMLLPGVLRGRDMGPLSEAGCPGVADPGADVVAAPHRKGI